MLELFEQARLQRDHVADAHQGEVRSIGAAGERIDRTGPGRAVTGAEHIDADHAVAAGLEQASVGEQARPPIRHPGRAGERVRNEDDVVTRRIGLAINRIAEGRRLARTPPASREKASPGE